MPFDFDHPPDRRGTDSFKWGRYAGRDVLPLWKERNTPAKLARDRDRGWCTVPGCSRPAANSHHIRFRSHGGGGEPPNRTSLCLAHHLHGVHKGFIRVRGQAPHELAWELGERG